MSTHRCHASRATALLLTALAAGCAAPPPSPNLDELPAWPAPPAEPRYRYEVTLRDSDDLQPGQASLLQRLAGNTSQNVGFKDPQAVAARRGMIYVSDPGYPVVHAFDVPRRRVFWFGYRFEGRLVKPMDLDLDAEGMVYLADAGGGRVVVYDPYGLFQRDIGGDEDFDRLTAVAVNEAGDRIYLLDTGGVDSRRHRIVMYDGAGVRLGEIGRRGDGPAEFNLPLDVDVGPDGTVYVLDAGNFRVQALSPDGEFLREWGTVGRGFGQFARPKSLAVDDEGRVYVLDASFGNVQIFSPEGELLLPVGRLGDLDRPGRYSLPAGVAVDETGRIYVLDKLFRKLEVIRPVAPDESQVSG